MALERLRARATVRLHRAAETARFAGKVVGVAATVAVLGILWAMLHDAEEEGALALAGLDDGP